MALTPIKDNQMYVHKPYVILSPEGQAVNGGRMVLHAGTFEECNRLADSLYKNSDCPVEKRQYPMAYNANTVLCNVTEETIRGAETLNIRILI